MRKFKIFNLICILMLSSTTAYAGDIRQYPGDLGGSEPVYSGGSAIDNEIAGVIFGAIVGAAINQGFNNGGYYYAEPSNGSYVDRMYDQSRNRLNQRANQHGAPPCAWFIQQANGNWAAVPDRCR